MDGGEFAALDTLQYGLARDTERAHCLAHRQEVLAGITVEAILEVFGESDTPRGAGCRLLAGNNAVIEQAMDGRWGDAKHASGLLDRHWFAFRRTGRLLEARNAPVAAQVADATGGEAMTICRGPSLPIEGASDHTIGVMGREPAQQRDRVLVGADGGRRRARQSEVDRVERAALPAQREMGGRLVAIDLDCDVFDEGAQQLLPVARRGRLRVPDGGKIGAEREKTVSLDRRYQPRPLFLAALQLKLGGLNRAQALLPVAFEAARHQPVVRIDSAIAALGALRLVIGSLDPEPPLFQRHFAFGFQPLSGGKSGGKPGRLQGSDKGPRDGLVDLDAANIEAIDAAVLDENLARAVVTWRGVATTIVGVQTAPAMATAGQTLQKRAALSYGAAGLVRSRPCIAGAAFLIFLVGLPVDKARMMLRDQHLPFGARQVSHPLFPLAGGIEDDLVTGSAIDVSAGVDGVGEHLVDGGIARLDPSDVAALMHPQREFQPLRAEPQPHAPGRAGVGEMGKDLANGGADGFVRVETNLAVRLAPDKTDGQTAPKFAARRLVANAAIEARAQDVQLCFAHR